VAVCVVEVAVVVVVVAVVAVVVVVVFSPSETHFWSDVHACHGRMQL
jgi:Flp pilus assembly pilin Flp